MRGNTFSELKCLLAHEHFDVISIAETFLDTQNIDLVSEYQLQGYKFFNKDRIGRRGGGVAVYIREYLNPTRQDTPDNTTEHLSVNLTSGSTTLNFNVVYRKPGQTVDEDIKLYNSLNTTINSNKESIIVGDFNLPNINWSNNIGVESESHRLLDFIDDNFLHQTVTEPTRQSNILDLVISSQENLVVNTRTGEHLGNCDHNTVRFDINLPFIQHKNSVLVPNFHEANYSGLSIALDEITLNQSATVEDAWSSFKQQFMNLQNIYIPLRDKKQATNNKPRWYNNNIAQAIRQRDKLYRAKKSSENSVTINSYNNARREVKKLIRQAKRQYELQIAQESTKDPKAFYGYINNRKQLKSGIGPLIGRNGDLTSDNYEIASSLNEYFKSVFTTENNDNNNAAQIYSQHRLPDITVTENDVMMHLSKMKTNKSPGPDKFYPKILKQVKDKITKHLANIFNMSLHEGKVPEDWKLADITPIFKKGDRKLPENYRPISLTSVICKLLETIIRDKIVDYLEEHELIRDTQHGFRRRRSCLTNLLEFYNKLFHLHDETKSLDIIYLDFQKAFDKVPHEKLLLKVEALGITGNTARWIASWLHDRKQRVLVNGASSPWLPVASGVPQGSVLGPVLFIIYINDIDVGLNNFISKFADDTKIGNTIITDEDRIKLQQDLNRIAEWSSNWQMPFNVGKCQVLHVGNSNNRYEYEMNGRKINTSNSVKDLGITLSRDLKFSQHCSEAAKKANRMLGFIKRNFTFMSSDIIIPLYKSLVRPHLEYSVQFWAPHFSKDIAKLETVQRRATKLIPSIRNKPYEDRLKHLDLYSLTKRRLRGKLIQCFKIVKGFDNVNMDNFFTFAPEMPTRGHSLKLSGHRVNLDATKFFFTNDIIDAWNRLPITVIESTTINMFKSRLDHHLSDIGVV